MAEGRGMCGALSSVFQGGGEMGLGGWRGGREEERERRRRRRRKGIGRQGVGFLLFWTFLSLSPVSSRGLEERGRMERM